MEFRLFFLSFCEEVMVCFLGWEIGSIRFEVE